MEFKGREVGGWRAGVAGIFDEVSAHCKPSALCFLFVWFELTYKFAVGYGAASGDLTFWNELDGIGADNAGTDSLGESTEFVCGRMSPWLFVAVDRDELPILQGATRGVVIYTVG